MRLQYDPVSDILTIRLRTARVHRSEEVDDAVSLLLDSKERVIGFVLKDARKRLTVEELTSVTYENVALGRRSSLTLP